MNYEDSPKSIKYHIKKYLIRNQERFKNKLIVDFPAGNGVTSRIAKDLGANVLAFDLFPEYFKQDGIKCERANIREGIPLTDGHVDCIICQEGIEHFSDQFNAFQQFSRILKTGGSLIITTPNYSNLRSRLSYFLMESERFHAKMPPNELDSIWTSEQEKSDEIYFGHIFLIGIQKLRVLAALNGFKIRHIQFTRAKSTSVLLFPFVYPFIWFSNWYTYQRNMKKNNALSKVTKTEVYKEIFRLGVDPKILVDGHLFVEFQKEKSHSSVAKSLRKVHWTME